MPIKIDTNLFQCECSHLAFTWKMLFWCVTGQEKIPIPNPTTFHHWDSSSAATFGRHNTEMWLKYMGRGWFPVFGLEILSEARLLGSLWVAVYPFVCGQVCSGVSRLWDATGGRTGHPPVSVPPLCRGSHLRAASAGALRLCLSSQESGSKAHVWIFKQKALANLPGKCNKNVFLKKIHNQNDR